MCHGRGFGGWLGDGPVARDRTYGGWRGCSRPGGWLLGGRCTCGRCTCSALGSAGRAGPRSHGGCLCVCRLLWLDGAPQSFPVGFAPGAVGLRVLDRRRVALDANPEVDAKVQGFLVGQPQLTGKLVDADFLGQLVVRSSPVEGQRSVRGPEPGAASYSHTTPVLSTPVCSFYGRGRSCRVVRDESSEVHCDRWDRLSAPEKVRSWWQSSARTEASWLR